MSTLILGMDPPKFGKGWLRSAAGLELELEEALPYAKGQRVLGLEGGVIPRVREAEDQDPRGCLEGYQTI